MSYPRSQGTPVFFPDPLRSVLRLCTKANSKVVLDQVPYTRHCAAGNMERTRRPQALNGPDSRFVRIRTLTLPLSQSLHEKVIPTATPAGRITLLLPNRITPLTHLASWMT